MNEINKEQAVEIIDNMYKNDLIYSSLATQSKQYLQSYSGFKIYIENNGGNENIQIILSYSEREKHADKILTITPNSCTMTIDNKDIKSKTTNKIFKTTLGDTVQIQEKELNSTQKYLSNPEIPSTIDKNTNVTQKNSSVVVLNEYDGKPKLKVYRNELLTNQNGEDTYYKFGELAIYNEYTYYSNGLTNSEEIIKDSDALENIGNIDQAVDYMNSAESGEKESLKGQQKYDVMSVVHRRIRETNDKIIKKENDNVRIF